MSDLMKRLRFPIDPDHHDPFKSGRWRLIHSQVLDAVSVERKEAADEIERLEKLVESQQSILVHSGVRKAVLDDMREWLIEREKKGTTYYETDWALNLIDAYEKDRMKVNDLVKRARIARYDDTQSTGELYGELCDEIERLNKAVVLDDIREWAKNDYGAWPTSPSEFLDAYEKDRE